MCETIVTADVVPFPANTRMMANSLKTLSSSIALHRRWRLHLLGITSHSFPLLSRKRTSLGLLWLYRRLFFYPLLCDVRCCHSSGDLREGSFLHCLLYARVYLAFYRARLHYVFHLWDEALMCLPCVHSHFRVVVVSFSDLIPSCPEFVVRFACIPFHLCVCVEGDISWE